MSDRKYRHQGYQDDGSRERRGRKGPPPQREGPRGRGMGAPTETVFRCASCGARQYAIVEVELDATCWKCKASVHTCTNCTHFDTSAPNECRQPVTQAVRGKAKANDCELFNPKLTSEFASDRDSDSPKTPDDAKAAFDALFKI